MAGNKREKGDGKGRQGGRQKGTPNKVTREKREAISHFVENNWQIFEKAYAELDPEKKCYVMLGLLPFTVPKLSSVEFKDKTPPKSFKDELDEDSGEKTRKK